MENNKSFIPLKFESVSGCVQSETGSNIPVHISVSIIYIPSKRIVVSDTAFSDRPADNKIILIPAHINNANKLIEYLETKNIYIFDNDIDDETRKKIDETFRIK